MLAQTSSYHNEDFKLTLIHVHTTMFDGRFVGLIKILRCDSFGEKNRVCFSFSELVSVFSV